MCALLFNIMSGHPKLHVTSMLLNQFNVFSPRIPTLSTMSYNDRLKCLNIRRLLTDLFWRNKVVFGLVLVRLEDQSLYLNSVTHSWLFPKPLTITTTGYSGNCPWMNLPWHHDYRNFAKLLQNSLFAGDKRSTLVFEMTKSLHAHLIWG